MPGGAVLTTRPDEGHDDLLFREAVRRHVDAPRFVRRDWLAADVEDELAVPSCRLVLVVGEPGVGKSGLLAQLATDNSDWPLYLLRRDQRSPLADGSARSFLLRIGFQLAALRPELLSSEQVRIDVDQRIADLREGGSAVAAEVDRILSSPFHQAVVQIRQQVRTAGGAAVGLRVGEWVADPRLLDLADLASMALLDPARVLARLYPAERLVILVDALDELADDRSGESLLAWLTATALPPNVRIVVTSRPEGVARLLADRHGDALRQVTIDTDDDRVRADLLAYARGLAQSDHVAEALRADDRGADQFVSAAVDKADGNVGYLDALGRALDQAEGDGRSALLSLAELPDDLAGLHAFFLRRLRAGPGAQPVLIDDPVSGSAVAMEAWPAVFRPLLQALCVALEPLTLDQLAGLSGTLAGRADVAAAVNRLSQFLDRLGDRHRLYHATFADFMTAAGTRADPDTAELYVDLVDAHRRLALRLRSAGERIWDDEGSGTPADQVRNAYARSYLVAHLEAAGLWDELFETLDDSAYGRGKVRADPSTFALCADLDRGRLAAARPAVTGEPAVELLPRLWRYSLLRHSLSSHADAHPDDSYVAMALIGRAGQAAQLAQLIGSPKRRAGVLSAMATAVARADRNDQDAAQLADLAAVAAAQVADPAEHQQVIGRVVAACGEIVEAGAAIFERTIDQLEQLAAETPHFAGTVSGLLAVARLREGVGDTQGTDRLLSRVIRLLNDHVDDPARDTGLAEYVDVVLEIGDVAAAKDATSVIHDVWAKVRAVTALARADQASAAQVAPALESLENAAEDADDRIAAAMLDARLAAAWSVLGDTDRAAACGARAVSEVEAIEEPNVRAAGEIAGDLQRLGDAALLRRLAVRLEAVGRSSIREDKPGHGFQLNLYTASVVQVLAALDETGRAVDVAQAMAPSERGGAFETVAHAHASGGRFDEALALAEEAARADASSSARVLMVASDGALGRLSTAERIRCDVVSRLAAAGNPARALEIARRLGSVEARAYGLSAVAVAVAQGAEAARAVELVDEVDRELRLTRAGPEAIVAGAGLMRVLVSAGAWDAAAMLIAERSYVSSDPLIDALMDAGEFERARRVIGELSGSRSVDRLLSLRKRATGDGGPVVTLEQVIAQANAIDQPLWRAEALLTVVFPLAEEDRGRAKGLVYDAVAMLNSVGSFPFRPTPWPRVCEAFVHVRDLTQALDLAGQIAAVDPFDGSVAFRYVARAARQLGAPIDVPALLEKADALAARIEFPPLQNDARAAVRAEFAAHGQVERALRDAADDWRGRSIRRAVARRLAEDGRALEALALLPPAAGQVEPTEHFAVLAALLDAREVSRAAELARSVTEPTYRAIALARVARHAESPQGRELAREAMDVLDDVDGTVDEPEAVEEVARALAVCGLTQVLLDSVRHQWSSAPDREHLARRVVAAAPLVASRVELAVELAQSERTVEAFLRSI